MLAASSSQQEEGYKIQTDSLQLDDEQKSIASEPTLTVLDTNNSSNEVIKKLTDLDVSTCVSFSLIFFNQLLLGRLSMFIR